MIVSYLLGLICSIILLVFISKKDKKICQISGNKYQLKYEKSGGQYSYDSWIEYYKDGRSRIYSILFLIAFIPFCNTALLSLLLLFVVGLGIYELSVKVNKFFN